MLSYIIPAFLRFSYICETFKQTTSVSADCEKMLQKIKRVYKRFNKGT